MESIEVLLKDQTSMTGDSPAKPLRAQIFDVKDDKRIWITFPELLDLWVVVEVFEGRLQIMYRDVEASIEDDTKVACLATNLDQLREIELKKDE